MSSHVKLYSIYLYSTATKVMTFTADNASNNNTLVDELSVLIPTFGGAKYHVRCFAHILNLVVKVGSSFLILIPASNGSILFTRQFCLFSTVSLKQNLLMMLRVRNQRTPLIRVVLVHT